MSSNVHTTNVEEKEGTFWKYAIATGIIAIVAGIIAKAYIVGQSIGRENERKASAEGIFWKYAIAAGVGALAAGLITSVVCQSNEREANAPRSANSYLDCRIDRNHPCVVCLDRVQHVKVLNCGHCFHEQCIQPWLTRWSTCPICRADS